MKARASRQDLLASGMEEEKVNALTRPQLRSYVVEHRRVGRRTGKTAHFLGWKAEGAVKSALQKTKTSMLAEQLDGALASSFALLSVGGFHNVWDVANADVKRLLAVNGIGVGRLSGVEKYLNEKSVTLAWTVAEGS